MSDEREYRDAGVSIPLSTIMEGGQAGVLSHLSDGLGQAERDLEQAGAQLAVRKAALEEAELTFARAEARAFAWRTAYDAAKKALGR